MMSPVINLYILILLILCSYFMRNEKNDLPYILYMNSFILEGYAEPNPYVKPARGLPAKPAQKSTKQNFIEKDSFDI
jgi:hypothetical protein